MRPFVLALIASIILVPVLSHAQEYVEVKTPNFTVISDTGETQAREIAEHFEQVRSAFGIFFNKQSLSVPVPLTIFAFKNSRDFQQFVPKFADKTRGMWPGTVRNGEDENLIAYDTSVAAENRRAVAPLTGREFADREYVKLLIAGNFPPVPRWYEEGVIEYCSSLRVTSKQLIYGVPRADLVSVLQTQPWMRVLQLFGPAPAAPEDWDTHRRTISYAQSWITMHYLMAANLGRQLNTFVDLVQNQHLDVQESIRRAFGVEPKAFENAVRNYFTLNITEYKLTLPADFGKGSFETRKLREADWLAAWGDLHYHSSRDRDLGISTYNRALGLDPSNAGAHLGLGYSALQRNDFDRAEAELQKALAADPGEARVHFFLAQLAAKRHATGRSIDLASVKQHLQQAIQLDPSYADAYQLLSWTESELKNSDAAHAAIEKAAELNPRNDYYALTSAQFDVQARQFDKARPVFERLQSSEQPEVARYAHQALATMGPRKTETSINTPRQQITAPQWQTKDEPEAPAATPAAKAEPAAPANPPNQKIEFLKGEIVAVDCSKSPMATLTVLSKGKSWVMFSRDVQKLMLIGIENFDCNWRNTKASVNYRVQADGRGEMISLEID